MKKTLYPLLMSVYFAQGIPAGLSAHALPVLLREQGVSLSMITLMNALALPWLLKFLWAPWVDRIASRARAIAAVQLCVALVFVVLACVSLSDWLSAHALSFVVLLVVINTLMASHDVLTDGLAVRLLAARERGFGNVFQVAGYKIGMVLGGSALLWCIATTGWMTGALSLAAIMIVLGMLILILAAPFAQRLRQMVNGRKDTKAKLPVSAHESLSKDVPEKAAPEPAAPEKAASKKTPVSVVSIWRGFLSQPAIVMWLAVVMFYKLGDALASSVVRPMWVDFGFDTAVIGGVGALALVASLIGAALGGILYRYLSGFQSLIVAGILQSVGLLGYAYCAWHAPTLSVWMLVFNLEQCLDGASTVVLFAAMMAVCRKTYAGSDYTLQASLFLAVTGAFKLVSGYLAQELGYVIFFIIASLLFIIPLLMLMYLRSTRWFTWFDAQQ